VRSPDVWSVERHLAGKPAEVVDLYQHLVKLIAACGPFTYRVSKTAITFQGTHRGFAGATLRTSSLNGYLDLRRQVRDQRILRSSRYTKTLFVHHFKITNIEQMDGSFAGWVHEAYLVGLGAHRTSPSGAG
jgi:hypothetical protein